MSTTWTALADPTRRAILDLLRERPHAVGEVVARLDLAQPTASKQLAVLRRAGLVRATVDAQRRVYALDPRPMGELETWLAPYRRLWGDALDAGPGRLPRSRRAGAGRDGAALLRRPGV